MENITKDTYKVLFTWRDLRQRRRETIHNPPEWFQYTSQYNLTMMSADYTLTWSVWIKKNLLHTFILWLIHFFQIPNIRYISKKHCAGIDLIHTPWQLLINTLPYVVEIDNVWCLWMYNYWVIHWWLWKNIIRYFLRKENCRRIVCISDAAKASVINFFHDKKITDKCVTSYPYVSDKQINPQNIVVWKPVKLLFISSDFYLKWWREVVEAFRHLVATYDVALYVITKKESILQEDFEQYSTLPNIFFIEWNLSKEELYNEYYLTCDIFVLPTYMDSFWLVFLEALSSWLAIITTRMFATPEMVVDWENWYLLDSPLNIFSADYTPNKERRWKDIHTYCKHNKIFFREVASLLKEKLTHLLDNPKQIERMKKASLDIYTKKFTESIRKPWLWNIYKKAMCDTI
jgi:glycosyltransferase involved in cell wall biosynthesis